MPSFLVALEGHNLVIYQGHKVFSFYLLMAKKTIIVKGLFFSHIKP